ncbi:MAG: tRNA preQ1(34) S-adenosylmethionine ribosyltransferase-isomerase QueA [Pseudomonadota bacterium]|nr:tRNA preQ1(34) S-adenosylmethionine ribosyltransferase-isomerase QueA [Pseudomonadota bacterium]
MLIHEFDFELPPELIAQHPPARRGDSRLLCLDPNKGCWQDKLFVDLLEQVGANDLLVFNDTRVIKARLFAQKQSGGHVELLVERLVDASMAIAHIKASHAPRPGSVLSLEEGGRVTVIEKRDDLYLVAFEGPVLEVLEKWGHVPLPPYIKRSDREQDSERYQTVYARHPGAVAAPTAGLHFDEKMLQRLSAKGVGIAYVTLHVGAGTFSPVRVNDVSRHKMHSEWYDMPRETVEAIASHQAAGGRVLAVGTTALRALEGAMSKGRLLAGSGETDIFITPGYRFQVVDRLITNFHLPCSTLFMLVCAFAGVDRVRRAYAHAVSERYRFFSYGDAMLIERLRAAE